LFFVALSRARNALTISSATRYTPKRTSSPSKFLAPLAEVLGTARSAPVVALPVRGVEAVAVPARDAHEERHLEVYSKCPARYRYEMVDGLAVLADRSAFLRFHGCVRQTLAWMSDEVYAGREVSAADAVARLDGIWPERGPVGGFAEIYLAEARRMVANAASALEANEVPIDRVLQVDVAGRTVVVRPDRVVEASDGAIVIRRYRTGRKSKGEAAKPIWSLLASAGEAAFPGREIRLEAFYPATAETERIAAKRGVKALDDYVQALDGIERGHFPPRASRECPSCQFYFICTAEDSF
jgi:hypothetical protein